MATAIVQPEPTPARAPLLEAAAAAPRRLSLAPARPLLVGCVALIVLAAIEPFSAAAGVGFQGLGLVLILVLALDLALGLRAIRRLRVAAAEPCYRWTEGRESFLELRVRAGSRRRGVVALAFHGVDRQACGAPDAAVAIPVAGDAAVVWTAAFRPQTRGVYRGLGARVEMASRMGFWQLLGEVEVPVTLIVYPDWHEGWRQVLASPLFQFVTGLRQQLPTGQGREFDRLREYLPGDAYQDVSWKATARRGAPVTRLFQWEQMQRIYVVIDHARLAGRVADGVPQLHRFVDAALALLATCRELGDAFGLAAFAANLTTLLPPSTGPAQFSRAREALTRLRQERVNPEFENVFAQLATRERRRSQFLILTDLSDQGIADGVLDSALCLARSHLVSLHCLLPEGVAPLFQRGQAPVTSVAEIYRRLAGHREAARLETYRREMARRGVTVRWATPRRFLLDVVETYLEAKRRQTL